MIPYNNYDKLMIKKLIIILHTLQKLYYDESNVNPNNLSLKTKTNTNTNHTEPFISRIPIIIAEKNIDIPVESTFKLENPALDIKSMKKDVYLTSSTLLPLYENHNMSVSLNGKLFLEGFIRNKLDFSIAKGAHDNIINLATESFIIYIPFKCTTLIQYKVPPIFPKKRNLDYIPIFISSDYVGFNKNYNENYNKDESKENTQCMKYTNCDTSAINCEINQFKIHETITIIDKTPFNKDFPIEIKFNTIKENIIINLSLTLLQKQDVAMNYKIISE